MHPTKSSTSKNTVTSFNGRLSPAYSRPGLALFARAVFAIFFFSELGHAQTIQYTQGKPDQALRSSMRVDPATLGLSLEVPIAAYPGRASPPINLIYSSKQWRFNFYDSFSSPIGSPRTISNPIYSEWAKAGWTSSADIPIIEWTGHTQIYNGSDGAPCDTCEGGVYYVNRIHVHMPGGASHELRIDDTPTPTPVYAGTYYAVDGSNLRYEATSFYDGTLFLADGSSYVLRYSTSVYQYIDRNGNTLNYNATTRQWIDTQGRVLDLPLPASPSATTYTYYLPSTTSTFSYGVRWSTLQNALTNPNDPLRYRSNMTGGFTEDWTPRSPALFDGDGDDRLYDPIGASGTFNPMVLAEIVLPNGQHYLFTYNVWGEITKVIYPTGGYERFDYAPVAGVGFLQSPYTQANRGVVDRWLSPTGNPSAEQHWHYAAAASFFGLTVSTTAPDNTLTERVMSAEISQVSAPYGFSNADMGMQLEERSFVSAGGAMLRRTLTKWASSGALPGGWYGATRNPRAIKQINILLDTGTSNALTGTTTMSYDNDLNVIATNHYDFTSISQSSGQTLAVDSITAGTLLRTDETTFLVNDANLDSATRAAYRSRNLLSLPTYTRVKNSLGTEVAKMKTRYDDYDETGSYQQGIYPLLTYGGSGTTWTDPGSLRGLPTTSSVWLDTTGSYLQTHAQYDQFGNLRNSWDANGKQSQMTYSSNFSYAYPTGSSTAVPDPTGVYGSTTALSSTADYNVNTGLMTVLTDANGQSTSYAYDAINRLATITPPNGGHVTYSYFDLPTDHYVRVLTEEDASRSIENRTYFDDLGRPIRSFLLDGTPSTPWLVTDTYYDNMGRVSQVSNPYRVSSPGASAPATCSLCTTSAYDALGRVKSVTTPDSAQVTSNYGALTSGTLVGTTVLVTDQTGKSRRSLTDSLGRLVRVDEPDVNGNLGDVGSPVQPTTYGYDVLGNLRLVTQGVQQRFFMYDSLSRLLRTRNPELAVNANLPALTDPITNNGQWSNSYTYDNNGNLTQKTDARGVVSSYGYDALNRNITVDYSDTTGINPDITRIYDSATNGKGRLRQSYAGGNETIGTNVEHTNIESYDVLGRPTDQRQRFKSNSVWSASFQTQRTYDLAGHVKTQSYPSGHTVTYNYDLGGRLGDKDAQNLAFTGNLGDSTLRTYSSEMIYSPLGGMTSETFGTDTALYNKTIYNSRGQAAEIRVGTYHPTDTTWWNRGAILNHYSDSCWGSCGGSNSNTQMTDNNGNLKKQEVYIPNSDVPNTQQITSYTTWWQQYNYDALNRLDWVREVSNNAEIWKQDFTYDRYGNRTIDQTNTWGPAAGPAINKKNFTVDTSNNRLGVPAGQSGTMSYDYAGNLTTDTYSGSGVTRAYDAENRMTSETQSNGYVAGSYGYNADGQRVRRTVGGQPSGVTTWQVYGMDGELLAEYAANAPSTTPEKEYGYRNGQLLITAEAPTRTNVALAANGGTTLASSSLTGYPASKVNDGDRKGGDPKFWADANPGNFLSDWVEVDFSGSKTISEIDVFTLQDNLSSPIEPTLSQTFGSYGATAYDVQYLNGSTWTAITGGNITGNNKVWRQFSFTPVTTSKIRVVVNAAQDNNYSRIVELEAWTEGTGSASTNLNWLVTDQLGTPRMVFDKTGSLAATKRHDYLPFGEEIFAGTGARATTQGYSAADGVRQKFTQKERDNETGLDYFLARYYSSAQGRFTSPDEFTGGPNELYHFADDASANPTFYADLRNPQSLNKYQYTLNNPLRYVDPDGHDPDETAELVLKAGAVTGTVSGQPEVVATAAILYAVIVIVDKTVGWDKVAKQAGENAEQPCGECNSWTYHKAEATDEKAANDGSQTKVKSQAFTPSDKRKIDAKTSPAGSCQDCGRETQVVQNKKDQKTPDNQRQRHHVSPQSQGGTRDVGNGVPLCKTCHDERHRHIREEQADRKRQS